MDNVDLTPIVGAVVSLVSVIITVIVIPYIKSKTTAEQQKKICAWVKIAVEAAEQIYAGVGRGDEKKQYVLDWLEARNIKVNADEINAMIEAAVLEMKNNMK